MKRLLSAILPLALTAGCLGSNPYRRMAKDLSAPLAGSKVRVAVLPFRGVDPALNAEGEAISERLLTHLYGRPGIELIERSRLQQVMSEMSLGATGALDGRTATEVGRLVGAQALVVGTLARGSKGLEAAARVVEVESGRVLAAAGGGFPDARNGGGSQTVSVPRAAPIPPRSAARPAPSPAEPPAAQRVPGRDLGPGTHAPWPVAVYGAVSVGRRVYVIGGTTPRSPAGRGESTVFSAAVARDGSLGRWREETPLPSGRYQVGAAAWGGWVFAVGGFEGSLRDEVFAAPVGEVGALGAWRMAGRLPVGCANPGVAAASGHLLVAGCALTQGNSADLFIAAIGADGALGGWEVARMPEPLGNCSLAAAGDRLFVVGGSRMPEGFSAAVYVVPLSDGRPSGPFSRAGSLRTPATSVVAAVHRGRLWVVGGVALDGPVTYYVGSVESASVGQGSLGPWRRERRLEPVVATSYAPRVDEELYVVGGHSLAGPNDSLQRIPLRPGD